MNLPFNNHIEKVFSSFEWFHGLINGVIQSAIIANFDQGVFHFETYFFSNTAGLDLSVNRRMSEKLPSINYHSEQKLTFFNFKTLAKNTEWEIITRLVEE